MALSQCLDDSPSPGHQRRQNQEYMQDLYNERHRLALEELVAGGQDAYMAFLKKERMVNFLSADEMRRICSAAAVPPRCADESGLEQSHSGSVDCSSLTYFPDVSDVEPPQLELGWPGFTTGSFRGITRAVAHFQPSYGECIYSCKEAARRMIKSAKEVIAVVTDSLTDLDIFRDLQEACSHRRVPVYLLLDQCCVSSFLQMCNNLGVRLEDLRNMRVRSITGPTYFLRNGAKITGKVHERFMLIDGNRVATGSYRFNWTDGKLNSSNLIELSGQITENYDHEFRVLYAQSLPLTPRQPPMTHIPSITPNVPQSVPVILTSTPTRPLPPAREAPPTRSESSGRRSPSSDVSTIGENWMEPEVEMCLPRCHASTQTSSSIADSGVQTEPDVRRQATPPRLTAPPSALRDCFRKLTKERQYHYSSIRTKLDHMVALLSHRRELGDLSNITNMANLALGPSLRRVGMEGQLAPPWSRTRCLQ